MHMECGYVCVVCVMPSSLRTCESLEPLLVCSGREQSLSSSPVFPEAAGTSLPLHHRDILSPHGRTSHSICFYRGQGHRHIEQVRPGLRGVMD
jgi:hypothetical protein